ncbi:serine/threonine-protein kinase pim-3-like [Sinocyclocheilus grahami]|uniref:serine/threonine-protein kinase pim-3-like n=1 Tax=Sinocyclocheilus grahami TaxID=75366 RepID=UPI0007ACB9A9|nr:PREDICTED: serine/threonine-protein kinase pim-3-like [Sinocyclocheilus grahami]
MSKCSDDVPQALFSVTSKSSDDVPPALFSVTSKSSDDVPPPLFSVMSKSSDDAPPVLFYVTSKCIDDVPPALFPVTSKSSDDISPVLFYVTSDCRDEALQASVRFVADLSVGVPQSPVHETLDCGVNVPQATTCAAPDCSGYAPQIHSSQLQDNETTIIDINSHRYEIGSQLGEGGFGTVYAATRLDDGLQVAIKFASNRNTKFISIDGCSKPLPLEVALQILANKRPRVEEIIQLLDWQVDPDYYFMVLERPMPCQSLYEYLKCYKGTMEEDVARVIMHQAIFAARMCCLRGVLHRDIKLENLLINPDTLELKLIDFGCGAILTDVGYTSFAGSREYCPPEYHMTGKYHGEPGTVWSLGILLFVILFSKFPKRRHLHKINAKNWTKAGLSKECCDLIRRCLQIDPKQRIELGKLSLHDWFMIADKKK